MFDGLSKTGKAEGPPELDSGASIVTPAQIVLLKILDAHLNSTDARQGGSGLATASLALLQSAAILEEKFRQLARWAEKAMAATLQAAKDSSQTAPAVDTRLVEVHVALILVVQCLTALLVATDKVSLTSSHGMTLESIVAQGRSEAFLSTLLGACAASAELGLTSLRCVSVTEPSPFFTSSSDAHYKRICSCNLTIRTGKGQGGAAQRGSRLERS